MKKLLAIIPAACLFAACENAGSGAADGDSIQPDNTTIDSSAIIVPGPADTSNDTMSYDRMPNRLAPDTTL